MAEQVKCCGTCKWFTKSHPDGYIANCTAPLPNSVYVTNRSFVWPKEGTDCPCYESKEGR